MDGSMVGEASGAAGACVLRLGVGVDRGEWGEWDGLDGCFVKRGSLGVGLVVGGRIV